MTVEELIAELKKCSKDLPVFHDSFLGPAMVEVTAVEQVPEVNNANKVIIRGW